jgi:hypothetical protein
VTSLPDPNAVPGGSKSQWVLGRVDVAVVSTNVQLIEAGLIYPYNNSLSIYKSPADRKMVGGMPTVRSMSANTWMNPQPQDNWNTTRGYSGAMALQVFKKQSDVKNPSMTWVFIDENPFTINDGMLVCDPNVPGAWIDIPATYHNSAGSLSFADGHSEIKKWTDQKILSLSAAPASGGSTPKDPSSGDLLWLQMRSTYSANQ